MLSSFWSSVMFTIVLVATLPTHVWTYRILMIPLFGKSHVFNMVAMANGLVSRGHEVTLFIGKDFPLNLAEISDGAHISIFKYNDSTGGVRMDYSAWDDYCTKLALESGAAVRVQLTSFISSVSQLWCRQLLVDNDDKLDELARQKFNVAVVDGLFFAKCVYLIPHRLQIPWITFGHAADPLAIRVPWLPSFVPSVIYPYSDQMTFTERVKNTAASFFQSFAIQLFVPVPRKEVLDKFRQYGDFNSLDELASKSALWFLILSNVLDYPVPMMPNMVDISGLTVKRSTGKLPPDIKNFIEGAEKGVILMTFGTTSPSIPIHMVEKFSEAFQRLDGYRVIWKLHNKDNVKLPDNVWIGRWLPQNDLLAHPSVKLFITHCGTNGQYEAVYHGVPMIGFPVLGDQHHNSRRLDHKGYGLAMNLHHFTADELLENIYKITEDKSYKERVMKASEIFRSQPQSPVERATFWIEHVCRFGGDHLRSAGNDLPVYSYLMLDILALVLISLHVFIYLMYRLLRLTVVKCWQHAASNDISKKND